MEPLNLTQLKDLCKDNLRNLCLVQPERSTVPTSRPKCSGADNLSIESSQIPGPSSEPPSRPSCKGIKCKVCNRTFKARRGLEIHYGRSPDCKRKVKSSATSVQHCDTDFIPLPSAVSDTVNSPSTSVESLENKCGDGCNTKIKLHSSKSGCGLCPFLSTKDYFVSSSTHRIHRSIIPAEINTVDCNSSNVIYLITCRRCRLQYVGETAQFCRCRISKHISCINHPENDNSCRILSNHFSQGHCKNATFTVHIIEKLPGNGRDENNKVDTSIARQRRKKETEWMLKLRTVYPYGLNDRIGDEWTGAKKCSDIFSKFPPLKRIEVRHKIRTKRPTGNEFIVDNFIYIINESLRSNIRNTMNLIRVLLSSLRKAHCRILYDRINDFLSSKHDTYRFFQFFDAALDIIKSKIGKPEIIPSPFKAPPSNPIHIEFNNKALDFIFLQKILRDKEISSALPAEFRKDTPTVIYKLTDTIRSKLFNYKKFVQSFDVDSFISDNSVLPCDCDHSAFKNSDHGHIICGDLNIVSDVKLRDLIAKGPKYREPLPFSCGKAKESILTGLDKCIAAWSNKAGVTTEAFKLWKHLVLDRIDKRISSCSYKGKSSHSILKDVNSLACLTDLQSKYVMVPIDKASNNIAFICKRYYATVLLKELGLVGSSTSTYTNISDRTPDDIIEEHQSKLKEQFNLSLDDDMRTLPDIYWTPKLHKKPVKSRFIIASKRCTTKTLSKDVSAIFSLFQRQIDTYHKMQHYFSGIKSYWIVQNRDPVLQAVKKSALRRSAKCVSSFDFSTLYTKIPHDKLKMVLGEIIDFAFKGGTRDKVSIGKSGKATWVHKDSTSLRTYSKDSIKLAVKFLVDNSYFKLGEKLFQQEIGIPMGSDPAPAFANLFLFHYESRWLKSIKKTNNILARKFGQVYRYIDDLLALNDGHSFETFFKDIYPEELQLNRENEDYMSTDFLDLHIEIVDGVFTTKLFDKRDDFGFDITRLPFKSSNIPSKMFYSSIAAECLRICRATSLTGHATSSIHSLMARMSNQGADNAKMKGSIRKMLSRHHINEKFGIHDNSFTNQLLSSI